MICGTQRNGEGKRGGGTETTRMWKINVASRRGDLPRVLWSLLSLLAEPYVDRVGKRRRRGNGGRSQQSRERYWLPAPEEIKRGGGRGAGIFKSKGN